MQVSIIKNAKVLAGSELEQPFPSIDTCDILIIDGYYAAIEPKIDANDKDFECLFPHSSEPFKFDMADSIIELDVQGRTLSPALAHFHVHPSFGTLSRLEEIGERTDSETAILGYDMVKQYQQCGFVYQQSAASANRDSDAGIAAYLQKQKKAGYIIPYFYPASEEITPVSNLGDVMRGKSFGRIVTGPYEARLEARKAAGLGCNIKINLSNDHLTGNANHTPTFFDEAEAAYKVAVSYGKYLQVHARSNASVKMATKLGASVIHHAGGIAYDDDFIKELKQRQVENLAQAENQAQAEVEKLFAKLLSVNESERHQETHKLANEIASELLSNQKQRLARNIEAFILSGNEKALQALLSKYYQKKYYFVFVPTFGATNAFYKDALENDPDSELAFQQGVERERVIHLTQKLLAENFPVLEGGDNALKQHPPFSEFEDLWNTQQDMQLSWKEVYKMITINGLKAVEMLLGEEDISEGVQVGMRAHGVIIDGDLRASGMQLFKDKGKEAVVGVIQDGMFVRLARNVYPKGIQAGIPATSGTYKKDLSKMLQKNNPKVVNSMFFASVHSVIAEKNVTEGLNLSS